jgi:gliding motility-associated-like protein
VLQSQPAVEPDTIVYQILKGESGPLNITGGIEYSWQPAAGLSNPTSGTTTASPASTTEYNVIIKDSLGCSTIGKVLILVEETAFIPNLFTPNDDGKNDALRIYGVNQVQNFSFSIYNREGSIVFDTSNIQEVSTHGWNGTVRGVDQPPGVYHWKVFGEYSNGQALLLNGKKTGSIILMR